MNIVKIFKIFLQSKIAVVSVEFSFILPVLLTLFFGMIEITNMIYTKQKLANMAEMSQNFIAHPRFDTVVGGAANTLTKINNFMIPKLRDIAGNYLKDDARFIVYVLDAGFSIPDPLNQIDDKTLYVAYRNGFGDTGIITTPRLTYRRTGTAGTPIDKTYFDRNKLRNDNDVIYRALGGKANFDETGGDQYIVIQARLQYNPIFSASRYVPLDAIVDLNIETSPQTVGDRFIELPDGGNMH